MLLTQRSSWTALRKPEMALSDDAIDPVLAHRTKDADLWLGDALNVSEVGVSKTPTGHHALQQCGVRLLHPGALFFEIDNPSEYVWPCATRCSLGIGASKPQNA